MAGKTLSRPYGGVVDRLGTDRRLIFVQSLVVFVLVWSIVSNIFGLTDILSSPSLVAVETADILIEGEWVTHLLATLRRTLYAFILTVAGGTAVGLLLGLSDFWEEAFQDYVTIGMALPTLLTVIFAAMWFGIGDLTPIIGAALATAPFMAESIHEGVDNIDQGLYEMSSSFGVDRQRVIREVVIPSVMPEWFSGVRFSFAICWKVVTLGEVIAANSGLGFKIQQQLAFLSMTGLLAWVLLFTFVIVFIEYGILQPVERRVFEWRPEVSVVAAR